MELDTTTQTRGLSKSVYRRLCQQVPHEFQRQIVINTVDAILSWCYTLHDKEAITAFLREAHGKPELLDVE